MEWNELLNIMFLLTLGSSLTVFLGMLTFVFAELLSPLGVLYARVKSLSAPKHQEEETDDEELAAEEPGEWSELEMAITDIKEELLTSKKRLYRDRITIESLLTSIPEGIVALNQKGQFIFFNPSFLDIFSIQNPQNSRLSEIIRSPEILDVVERCLDSGQRQKTQIKINKGSGQNIYNVTASSIRNAEGEGVFGVVCVFQDVTELKQLEQVRIDFVANVSHELRTPLTSVKGYAQTLLQDIKEHRFDMSEKYLDVVNRNVDRLLALVDDLLDLSSIESSQAIKKQTLSTRVLTKNVLDQVELLRAKKNIKIIETYSAESIYGDEVRVQQVLMNLVQNAIQYIPEERTIEITWSTQEAKVVLSVQDNGPGIDSEHTKRIFERFYRIDKARTTREQGGTGLGLAIVKHIMQRHGGAVTVESRVGLGTKFVCDFPHPDGR